MKRKEPKQTSPVQLKKNRSSIGEVGSPTPASSVEEQKRRAKEWAENEERKKVEANATKGTAKPRSKTPTTKTPSKKEKAEVEEEPVAPRSTRKTARASETPSRNRTASARVEVEFIDDDEEESEEEEEVAAPPPKIRKTSSAKVIKEEPTAAVKTPRTRKAAPTKVPTPILSPEPEPEPESPRLTKAQNLEEERRRARKWYEEQERNKIVSPSSSAPKSASKTPAAPKSATKSATKPVRSTTTTPNKAATVPVIPANHPATSGASGAQCPFAFAAEAERERVPETFNPHANSANTVPANDCHQTLAVSVALAAVPLGAIAYYDPKIAVTTLVILFVLSVVRRIFAMIADAEKNI